MRWQTNRHTNPHTYKQTLLKTISPLLGYRCEGGNKVSCRREAARCSVSLTILISNSSSLIVDCGLSSNILLYFFPFQLSLTCTSQLADELHHPAESEFRKRLRSASSHELSVPRTRPTATELFQSPLYGSGTVFRSITSAPSLPVFCSRLKTYFFELCYP